ncbi:MAG: alkaline phosphatase family protein, partial [Hymenobacteraceae bacterium]|nr:alkaline phosphatase family protein [Hymenobacteraceae bacterium]
KKKLGFRTVMDIIPLDATLIKGSHGHLPADKNEWPVLLTKYKQELPAELQATDIFNLILDHLQTKTPVPKALEKV